MTQRRARTLWSALILVVAAGALSGCAGSDAHFSDLGPTGRDATLPAELPSDVFGNGDKGTPTTVREVGQHSGATLWLVETVTKHTCLLVYLADDDWYTGCTERPDYFTVAGETAGEFIVQPDGYPVPEHAIQVSKNVFARGSS